MSVIVVGLDLCEFTSQELRLARRVSPQGATIRLVHVIDSAVFHEGAPWLGSSKPLERATQALIRASETQLNKIAEETRTAGFQVETVVKFGRPADELLAALKGSTMVALSTACRGAISRFFVNSIAEEVARRSSVPVLVVREGVEERPTTRILLAIDPRGPATDAIRAGALLADRIGAKLEAIQVAHLPIPSYADAGTTDALNAVLAQQIQAAPGLVREALRKAVERDLKVNIVTGSPAEAIARFAGPSDIVVCGTGRSGPGRHPLGSVPGALIREGPCPLLIVRPSTPGSGVFPHATGPGLAADTT